MQLALLPFNPIQCPIGPHVESAVQTSQGRPMAAVHFVGCQQLEFRARLHDEGLAFTIGEIQLAVGVGRRSGEVAA